MTTDSQQSTPPPVIQPVSARQAAILQLAPGVISFPAFALIAWWLSNKGIPNMFALVLAILLVEAPVTWTLMIRHVRRENNGQFTFARAFPWLASIPWWQYLLIGVPMIFFSIFMLVGVSPRISPVLLQYIFGWVPEWFVMSPDPSMFAQLSKNMLLALWALVGVGMVLIGGFTQELYSRGFLLPRMAHLGWWAPAYNALLFAALHLVAPWSWPAFFIMALPWAYLVWWRRSVKIGLFIHVGMLAMQWVGMTMLLFGLAPPVG